ncbi:hypothetical protein K438DRAFT_1777090 [Mycena galopus ATCC 62051]|nr:hypothetical protein K438DRAFT_1777090 [Mycena galopus ATCC 62051]
MSALPLLKLFGCPRPHRRQAAERHRSKLRPGVRTISWRAAQLSPKTPVRQAAGKEGHFLNFVIRGAGIVSSSAMRTERRYRELQSRGEEPELLVTRCLQEASSFAVDEGDGV